MAWSQMRHHDRPVRYRQSFYPLRQEAALENWFEKSASSLAVLKVQNLVFFRFLFVVQYIVES